MNSSPKLTAKRQAPLVASYTQNPQKAIMTDFANSHCAQPHIADPFSCSIWLEFFIDRHLYVKSLRTVWAESSIQFIDQ